MIFSRFRLPLLITTLLVSTMIQAEPSYYKDTETLPYSIIETLDEDIEVRHYN
ncbi:MAG: hypothetical protein ACI90R_000563, partial [Alteromonas macleodii]